MSKYHPLDVRHPSNRSLLHRNYLLHPPAPVAERVATERPLAAGSASTRSRTPFTRSVAGPWGGSAAAAAAVAAVPAAVARRAGGISRKLRLLIFGLIALVIVARQTDLLEPVLWQLRLWARQLGFELPF